MGSSLLFKNKYFKKPVLISKLHADRYNPHKPSVLGPQ